MEEGGPYNVLITPYPGYVLPINWPDPEVPEGFEVESQGMFKASAEKPGRFRVRVRNGGTLLFRRLSLLIEPCTERNEPRGRIRANLLPVLPGEEILCEIPFDDPTIRRWRMISLEGE